MSKYTKEFKLKVAKYCLEERHSYGEAKNFFLPILLNSFEIPNLIN